MVNTQSIRERVNHFKSRSLKRETKLEFLKLAVSMIDLTTLEGQDTPEKIKALCHKARTPHPDSDIPRVAAVCVYPTFVALAKACLKGTDLKVASVATGFPAGQLPLEMRCAEIEYTVAQGADEVDVVMSRQAFHSGNYKQVQNEIRAFKAACGDRHLKVILETGELGSLDKIQKASWLAMEAGADFIKTSTGKISVAATFETTLVMLEAIRDFYKSTAKIVGMKPAGGISDAKTALQYLVMVAETLGERWLTNKLFRFGASRLLNDLLRQIVKQKTGIYQNSEHFSIA